MAAVRPPGAPNLADEIRTLHHDFLQDSNGDDIYSNQRAMFGYLADDLRLAVPEAVMAASAAIWLPANPRKPAIDLTKLGGTTGFAAYTIAEKADYDQATDYRYFTRNNMDPVTSAKFALMNYTKLKRAGLDGPNAYVVAMLRNRWTTLGCLMPNLADRGAAFDEVRIVDATETDAELLAIFNQADMAGLVGVQAANLNEMKTHAANPDYGQKWIIHNAEAIWATSEYMFRTRGHHYKKEYEPLIQRILSANHEGNFAWPDAISYSEVFHTAVHPFGVKALAIMTGHFALKGLLGNALLMRLNAAPNGVAAVTTSSAVIKALATEPWFVHFMKAYGPQIEFCEAAAKEIMKNRYAFHMAANLYGLNRIMTLRIDEKDYTVDEAIAKVSAVATAGQGFIMAMHDAVNSQAITSFSFANAKALEKHASINPLASVKVRQLIMLSVTLIEQAKNIDSAAKDVFPSVGGTAAAAQNPPNP